MAIQLSAYLWLRNNDFSQMTEYSDYRLKREDKPKLKKILDELDQLHDLSDMVEDDGVLIGPNPSRPLVIVPVQRRVIERSLDRKRSGELFLEIHKILRKNSVEPSVYARLGCAYKELDIEPYDEDFKGAIEYGTTLCQRRENWFASVGRTSGSRLKDSFCWETETKRKSGPSFYREH